MICNYDQVIINTSSRWSICFSFVTTVWFFHVKMIVLYINGVHEPIKIQVKLLLNRVFTKPVKRNG